MITKEIATTLTRGKIILAKTTTNTDGSLARYRVNGKVKTWKRNPARFQIPVKRGLYENGYITEENGNKFQLA